MSKLLLKKSLPKMQRTLNEKLGNFFQNNGITYFRLTSIGNSIASGYSVCREIRPLLLRNESLGQVMRKFGVEVDVHSYSRAQNNCDSHIYSWLTTNIRESEVYRLNRNDYGNGPTSMMKRGISEEEMDKYYPWELQVDMGLQDAVLESSSSMANVVVYNGGTGSFLDIFTRGGNIVKCYTEGIMRDVTAIEATLMFVQEQNRKNNSNTQIYLCGAPNLMGIGVTEVINCHLRCLARKYANVVYVEPVVAKCFYRPLPKLSDGEQGGFLGDWPIMPDIHYDEKEYMRLNNKLLASIADNYDITQAMIDVDRAFFKFSEELETEFQQHIKDGDYIQKRIESILENSISKIKSLQSRQRLFKRLRDYLLGRFPFDFHYIGKSNMKKVLRRKRMDKKAKESEAA